MHPLRVQESFPQQGIQIRVGVLGMPLGTNFLVKRINFEVRRGRRARAWSKAWLYEGGHEGRHAGRHAGAAMGCV